MSHDHASWRFNEACRLCRYERDKRARLEREALEAQRIAEEAEAEEIGFRHLVVPSSSPDLDDRDSFGDLTAYRADDV